MECEFEFEYASVDDDMDWVNPSELTLLRNLIYADTCFMRATLWNPVESEESPEIFIRI